MAGALQKIQVKLRCFPGTLDHGDMSALLYDCGCAVLDPPLEYFQARDMDQTVGIAPEYKGRDSGDVDSYSA